MNGLELRIGIKQERRHEFLQAVKWFCRPELCGNDCLEQHVFERIDAPNSFIWIERWNDANALAAYQASERFRALLGAIEVLGQLDAYYRFGYTTPNDTSNDTTKT